MSNLIYLMILAPIALAIAHALTIRVIALLNIKISNQKLLILCTALFNIPLLMIITCSPAIRAYGISVYIYSLFVFNSYAYFYFHIFNMSETARRIKLLVGIKKGRIKKLNDIAAYYDDEKALMVRLERLEQISQIKRSGDIYTLKSRLFSNVYYLVLLFRNILGFDNTMEEGDM